MITELFGTYGCYLGTDSSKYVVEHPDDWSLEKVKDELVDKVLYPLAREATEGWDGLHGFEGDEDEDEDEYNERMEDNAEYWCEPWDEDEHASRCTFNSGLQTEEISFLPA